MNSILIYQYMIDFFDTNIDFDYLILCMDKCNAKTAKTTLIWYRKWWHNTLVSLYQVKACYEQV